MDILALIMRICFDLCGYLLAENSIANFFQVFQILLELLPPNKFNGKTITANIFNSET